MSDRNRYPFAHRIGLFLPQRISSMLKLFYAAGTCSLASLIALEDAGVPYETVRLEFSSDDQRKPDYLKINPQGRVPTLLTDRGVLTETPAILAFIARHCPAAELAPRDDPFAFAQVQSFNSYLCSTVHVAHAHRMRGHRWSDDPVAIDAMKRYVPKAVGDSFGLIEREMFRGPWVMGDAYTICDAYLFTLSQWLEADGVDIARFPAIRDHRMRMSARPAVKRAVAREQQP